jgi:tetratricopeptide (TPR) repeat protein
LLRAGEVDRAAERFADRLARDPDDTAAMVGRVHALLAGNHWRTALDESRHYAEARSRVPSVRAALGEALFRAGRLEEAQPLAEELTSLPDAPARALVTLGRLREAQGRFAEAAELMQRAVDAAPDDRTVLYWAADATTTRAEAIARLERYLELSEGDDPDRIEAARGSVRLFRSLGERPIWIHEHRPERTQVPLTHVWDPATGRTIGYVIQARVGDKGKRVRLLLDTGSPGLLLVHRVARKRGFVPISEQTSFGGGGRRRHRTRRGFFDTFAIGELRFREALATSTRSEIDPAGRFQGVLGLSVFNGYRVILDLPNKLLRLEPGVEAAPGGVPYWVVGGQWLVRASASDGRRDGLFLFDTGATRTLLSAGFVEGLGGARLRRPVEVRGVGGAIQGVQIVDGIAIEFQGKSVGPSDLRAVDLSLQGKMGGVELSGFLGLDLLDGSRITVDTVHRVISLAALGP